MCCQGVLERLLRPGAQVAGGSHCPGQRPVELAGDVSLQTAADLLRPLALGGASSDVGPGGRAVAHAGRGDDVDGLVERTGAAAVEPVSHGPTAAGFQRADPAQCGEGGVVSTSTGVGEGHDDLGSAHRPDPRTGGHPGDEVLDNGGQLRAVGPQHRSGVAQCEREPTHLGLPNRVSTIGVAPRAATDEAGERGGGESGAGELPVGVVAGQQQRPQTVGLRSVDGRELVTGAEQDPQPLGRSRGGLTSKIHLAVDGRGLPMSIILTPGQAGDNPQLLPLLDQVAVGRDGPGRPRKRPERPAFRS